MSRIKTKTFLLFSLLAIILISCADADFESKRGEMTGKEIDVRISLQMPASLPKTYAISEIDENHVREIDVLAFKEDPGQASGWAFAYKAKATSITDATGTNPNKAKKQFTVRLIKDPENEQTLVILANSRAQLEALGSIAVDADKDELLARLVYSNSGKWNANNDKEEDDPAKDFDSFPMWGEAKATLTDAPPQIADIHMLRAVAGIDVVLDRDVANFTLDEIHIYNSKNAGRIVPDPANLESPARVNAATEPPGNINNGTSLVYTVPSSMNTTFERTIYLFEAQGKAENQSSLATCVVVGGTFGTDGKTTYYRLDFLKKETSDSYFRDILRNHRYTMNITSVTGSGYDDPDDAFNSKSINMVADIVDWDDGDMGIIAFDGQHILSVSRDEFSFMREAKSTDDDDNLLYVRTDCADGWSVDKIVDEADGTTEVTWLTLTPDSGAANGKTEVHLTYEENNTNAERCAIVWIEAGRLRYPIRVTQSIMADLSLRITKTGTSEEITELLFVSRVDAAPNPQSMTVSWKPLDADLTIVSSAIGSNAFPTSLGTPTSGTIPAGNGATGEVVYAISPPAMTPAETDPITGDPFLEKVSLLSFMVTNGFAYENKNVLLRQVNYNLLSDVKSGYKLNSQYETIRIRSNFAWEITSVTDDHGILQDENTELIGIRGSVNTTTGTSITIHMSPQTSNGDKTGKTATITLTNQADDSTWDITVTAVENVLYVGRFGGDLIETDGVWQFEQALYVQDSDESINTQWSSTSNTLLGVTNNILGKQNTYDLHENNPSDNFAAKLCFEKNDNYVSITGVTNPDYQWYLPAQKQLMAIWISHSSFATPLTATDYWSATEFNLASSWGVEFGTGITTFLNKVSTNRVRCVREF
jgi:hypothetical protein